MSIDYHHHVRTDITALLPPSARRIVDVGCGSGETLAWLRRRYPDAHTIGLEGNPVLLAELARNTTEAHIVDITGDVPDVGMPDLMLFLDVLEHLADPAAVLRRLTASLADGGVVIVSLPNVAHLSVALPLLLRGEFTYADAGILDRTHLRFYTRDSAVALLNGVGLSVERGLLSGATGPRTRLLDGLTLGLLRFRLAKQLIMRGERRADGAEVGPAQWALADAPRPEPGQDLSLRRVNVDMVGSGEPWHNLSLTTSHDMSESTAGFSFFGDSAKCHPDLAVSAAAAK